jgi:cation transport regulator ChaC
VVTLVPDPAERCWGLAYRLPESEHQRLLGDLDHRERGGYQRCELRFHCEDDERTGSLSVLAYVAHADNEHYLGPATAQQLAAQVLSCHGPSGANTEYVLELSDALGALGVTDPHVSALARLLRLGADAAAFPNASKDGGKAK